MIPDLSNYFSNTPVESPYKSKEELTKALQQKYGDSTSSLVIGTTPEAFAALVDRHALHVYPFFVFRFFYS